MLQECTYVQGLLLKERKDSDGGDQAKVCLQNLPETSFSDISKATKAWNNIIL